MKKILSSVLTGIIVVGLWVPVSFADNPIVQTVYTADVAPMVHDGVMYVYTGHDEDELKNNNFTMNEWRCYSSTDMANWTDCGSPLDYKTFEWAKADAWASQCIEKDGKFYFYAPVVHNNGKRVIGVAVADSPTGPFKDAIGAPLEGPDNIDPTVFIDDDDRIYLYWGGSNALYYGELNDDMISFKSDIVKVDTNQGINGPGGSEDDFYEGPWLYKRGSLYYMVYSGNICESIYYATSSSPTGPWTHRGKIMNDQGWMPFTNHVGIVDYKDHSYIFYHNAGLPGGWGYKRSVCVEEFKYNDDGTIPFVPFTKEGPAQLGGLNPYDRVEAETIAWEEGIKTEPCNAGGVNVYSINNNDYIKVKGVDFDNNGASSFIASIACGFNNGKIELHLDRVNGDLIGTIPVAYTGGENIWQEKMTNISGAVGKHDLYLVFKGDGDEDLFKFDYWKFGQKSETKNLAGIYATVDKPKIDKVDGKNTANLSVTAIYEDGTIEDVTSQADVTTEQSSNISINNGVITGINYGEVSVNVNYGGKSDTVNMLVKNLDSEVTAKSLTLDKNSIEMLNGSTETYKAIVEYEDGHTEDITDKTELEFDSNIVLVKNGTITAKSTGETTVTVSYKGKKGDVVTARINITVINLNPFINNEAEDYHEQDGVQVEDCSEGGKGIGYITNGNWIKYNSVDFGSGAVSFEARLASATAGGNIEIHLDSLDGPEVGTLKFSGSNGWQNWVTQSCDVDGVAGIHALYLKFTGGDGNLFNMNWWKFNPGELDPIIKLDKTETKLKPGREEVLTAYIMPESTSPISFTSSDVSVVAVGESRYDYTTGKTSVTITAVSEGTAQVTASSNNAKDAVCSVTVTKISDPVTYKIVDCNPQYEGNARAYSGDVVGYLDKGTNGNPDGAVTFTVNVEDDGFYSMNIWNVVWGDEIASHIYTINGNQSITYEYPASTGWYRLSPFSQELKLNKGSNTIKISANSGAADLVYVELQFLGDANETTNPYIQNEAELYRGQSGVQIEDCSEGGRSIGYIENGDWIMYRNVDFGTGAASFEARVSSETSGGNIEIHLDSIDGPIVGTLKCPGSGSWLNWVTNSCEVQNTSGVHDLYLKFTGGEGFLMNMNWWKFTLFTEEPSEDILPTITNKEIENNELKLSVSIANNTDDNSQGQSIVALYDENNNLKSIKMYDFSVESKKSTEINAAMILPDNTNGHTIKVFFWDDINMMKPLTEALEVYLY